MSDDEINPGGPNRYKIARHAALKRRTHGEVLVLPEQAIRLGGSSVEILRLCIEPRSVHEIEAILSERYPDETGLASEVERFLTEMLALGGVEQEEEASSERSTHRGNRA